MSAQEEQSVASNAPSAQLAGHGRQSLSSTPQQAQTSPSGTQHSEQVEVSAYSVVPKLTPKAAGKAAAKDESADDDVELTPEERGFGPRSEDPFAALKAKMEVAQGKKKKKYKKEAAAVAAATTADAAAETGPAAAAELSVIAEAAPNPTESGVPTVGAQPCLCTLLMQYTVLCFICRHVCAMQPAHFMWHSLE